MKTLQRIVELARETPAGQPLAMATVVRVRGSAYRRPGARMLVTAEGRTAGMISGGCLEQDAKERAREVMETGRARLVTYDSTAAEDIVFGLGLGCNGIVQVLFEPLVAGEETGLLGFLSSCVARRQVGRIATVIESNSLALGYRLLRWPDGSVESSTSDSPSTDAALLQTFQECANRRTALRELALPDDRAACVFVEAITPPVQVTIFGAADDALPLAHLAKLLGWHVSVIDARPAYATRERFPDVDALHCLRPAALPTSTEVVIPPESLVMLMTHSFTHDLALLRVLLPEPPRYVGILGPKSRTARLLDALSEQGLRFPDETLARLHGPAGLDIGAETPEEIAISIIAEMQSVLAQRRGGALRDRLGPIHDPADQPAAAP